MSIYLINDHDGEEAAYEVQTEAQVEAIQAVDAGAYRCDFVQYLEMQQRIEELDGEDEEDEIEAEPDYDIWEGYDFVLAEYETAKAKFQEIFDNAPEADANGRWPYWYVADYESAEKSVKFHQQEIGRWVLESREKLNALRKGNVQ